MKNELGPLSDTLRAAPDERLPSGISCESACIALKEHELEQDLISEPYFVQLRREMNRLPKRCPAVAVSDLTPARLVAYFESQAGPFPVACHVSSCDSTSPIRVAVAWP